jgi:hypothetical protein
VTRELEYLREALEEAETAARWDAERSPAAAAYLLRRFPFSIGDRVEPRRILIVAVAHGRRRPGY